MSSENYEQNEFRYGESRFESSNRRESSSRKQPTMSRKRGKSPQSVNGIHRRRKRKMAW